jgi:predicted ATPase/DNA-binding CsgD family transcriptional regulator
MAIAQRLLCREDVRLLTLTGPGGTGKTRLALQVAAELSDHFADGVFFVNLAPISNPALVVPTIAQTLEVKETEAQPQLVDHLKIFLRDKHLLLLLDNFEQVIGAASRVTDLLATCPKLKIVVTSRAVLHVRSEQEFAVPPLTVPDPNHLPDLVKLSHYEAVVLFISRARAVKPEFQMTHANARAVAEICARLDGLPLAIELAAARIKLLPPQALLARLGQRLELLTGGVQDVPARQQTLHNTITWSYDLLDVDEQKLFRRLCVFVGGCSLEAVETMYDTLGDTSARVLDGVSSLLDKSLLQRGAQEEEEPHFSLLETIREYGLACLTNSGEMDATKRAHAFYFLLLAEKAEPELGGSQQTVWLERLGREHDNLRAALNWMLEQDNTADGIEMALRLGTALRRFWQVRGHFTEGRSFLEQALARSVGLEATLRAKAYYFAGVLAWFQGDYQQAEVLAEQSLVLYRQTGDQRGIATSLYGLGRVALAKRDYTLARTLAEEALAILRTIGDRWMIGYVLESLARVAYFQGDYARARSLSEESLSIGKGTGDRWAIARVLLYLARIALSDGDHETAHSLVEEGLLLSKEVGDKGGIANALYLSAHIALRHDEIADSHALAEESLALSKEIGDRPAITEALDISGMVAAAQGDYQAARLLYAESFALAGEIGDKLTIAFSLEDLANMVAVKALSRWAARLWGSAEAIRTAIGAPLTSSFTRRLVATIREQLGEKVFTAAKMEGMSMTPEQALSANEPAHMESPFQAGSLSTASIKPKTAYPAGLTAREVEVLRLVAQGLTDAQVADRLVISPRTVNTHLTSIYNKLSVDTRTAASRFAVDQQLV